MKLGLLAQDPFVLSFRKLMQQKVPVKTSFKLRGLAKLINEELLKYNETKEQLALEHALKDEKGEALRERKDGHETIKLDPAQLVGFIRKMKELDALEVEIPTLSIKELGKESELTLVPDDYFNLEFLQE